MQNLVKLHLRPKRPFPLIARILRINSQNRCEYFHPITILENLFQ